MAPKQVIFESSTPLLKCSTLKHTALIFLPLRAFHCPALPAHDTFSGAQGSEYVLVSTAPCQVPDCARIPAFDCFLFRESWLFWFVFSLSLQCFICFCSSGNKANPPGLGRQLHHNMPFLRMSSPQHVIRDFHSTPPDALHYSKLNCSVTLAQKTVPIP